MKNTSLQKIVATNSTNLFHSLSGSNSSKVKCLQKLLHNSRKFFEVLFSKLDVKIFNNTLLSNSFIISFKILKSSELKWKDKFSMLRFRFIDLK